MNKIFCGNAVDVLRSFPAESVNMCVTSPPYYGLRDYGIEAQIGNEQTPYEYIQKLLLVFNEVKRVLKTEGRFVCSTYGNDHMREVSELVQKFDDRIVLAAKNLYERFGKENGEEILKKDFEKIEWRRYEDSLIVPEPEPLISYILSCHGNQGQYILDHYKEFQSYVRKKTEGGFHITKDAGIFVGYNS